MERKKLGAKLTKLVSSSEDLVTEKGSECSASLKPLLEKQLFNDSVMRLWRTGADHEAWNPLEDDQTLVIMH